MFLYCFRVVLFALLTYILVVSGIKLSVPNNEFITIISIVLLIDICAYFSGVESKSKKEDKK